MSNARPWVVLKFGGTSVSGAKNWPIIADIVRERHEEGLNVLIVCSALSGVSNILESAPDRILAGEEIDLQVVASKHAALAKDLGIDFDATQTECWKDLEQFLKGVEYLQSAPADTRAKIMSTGELLSTTMAAQFLNTTGLEATWIDAREHLKATPTTRRASEGQKYLSSTCIHKPVGALAETWGSSMGRLAVTQGFICSNEDEETVLLGRGGSDTSAAYFGTLLNAKRVEIWTDVAGIFTANPRQVPDARAVKHVSFDEAFCLTTLGAKVLHPRCLLPVKEANIPMWVKCTPHPNLPGTVVDGEGADGLTHVKAIASRSNLTAFVIRRIEAWQPVGFIAEIGDCFKEEGISIDLIASSPAEIRLTVDPAGAPLGEDRMTALLERLREEFEVEVIEPVSSMSIVGSKLRKTLGHWGENLGILEPREMHFISHGANDLHLSFVGNPQELDELVRDIHARLFSEDLPSEVFGPTHKVLMEELKNQKVRSLHRNGSMKVKS